MPRLAPNDLGMHRACVFCPSQNGIFGLQSHAALRARYWFRLLDLGTHWAYPGVTTWITRLPYHKRGTSLGHRRRGCRLDSPKSHQHRPTHRLREVLGRIRQKLVCTAFTAKEVVFSLMLRPEFSR